MLVLPVAVLVGLAFAAAGAPVLLRVVLYNLLGHAWKLTMRRAQAHIELGAEEVDGAVMHLVRDEGAGFDRACAEKLRAPLQRLRSADELHGTSVGPATADRVVHRHLGAHVGGR